MSQHHLPLLDRVMNKMRRKRSRKHEDLESATTQTNSSGSFPTEGGLDSLPFMSEGSSSSKHAIAESSDPAYSSQLSRQRYYNYCGFHVYTHEDSFDKVFEARWKSILNRLTANMNSVMFSASPQMTSCSLDGEPVRTILIVCEDEPTLQKAEALCSQLDWFQAFVIDNNFRVAYAVAPNAVLTASAGVSSSGNTHETQCSISLYLSTSAKTLCGAELEIRSPNGLHCNRSTVGGIVVHKNEIYAWTTRHSLEFEQYKPQSHLDISEGKISRPQTEEISYPNESQPSRWSRLTRKRAANTNGEGVRFYLDTYEAKFAAHGSASTPTYDWCLLKLSSLGSDDVSQLLKPNMVGIRPIQGLLSLENCARGDVTISGGNAGIFQGSISNTTEAIVSGGSTYLVRRIVLDHVLERGCSGAWVSQDGYVIGYLVAANERLPWAYMVSMEDSLNNAEQLLGSPVRIASDVDIIRFNSTAHSQNYVQCSPLSHIHVPADPCPDSSNISMQGSESNENTVVSKGGNHLSCNVRSSENKASNQTLVDIVLPQTRTQWTTVYSTPRDSAAFFEGHLSSDTLRGYPGHLQVDKFSLTTGSDRPTIESVDQYSCVDAIKQWLCPTFVHDEGIASLEPEAALRILMIKTKNEFARSTNHLPANGTILKCTEVEPTLDSENEAKMVQEIFRHTRLPADGLRSYTKSKFSFSNDVVSQGHAEGLKLDEISRYYCTGTAWSICWNYNHTTKSTYAVLFYRDEDVTQTVSSICDEILRLKPHLTHPLLLSYVFLEIGLTWTFRSAEQLDGQLFEMEKHSGLATWDWTLNRKISADQGSPNHGNNFEDEHSVETILCEALEQCNVFSRELIDLRFRLRYFREMIAWIRRTNNTYARKVEEDVLGKECVDLNLMLDRMDDFNKIYSHDLDTLSDRLKLQMSKISLVTGQYESRISLAIADTNNELAWSSKNTNDAITAIAIASFLFLPATFVASVFDTPIFNWKNSDHSTIQKQPFWVFWLSCVLTIITLALCWTLYARKSRAGQQHRRFEERTAFLDLIRRRRPRKTAVRSNLKTKIQQSGSPVWSNFWSSSLSEIDVEKV